MCGHRNVASKIRPASTAKVRANSRLDSGDPRRFSRKWYSNPPMMMAIIKKESGMVIKMLNKEKAFFALVAGCPGNKRLKVLKMALRPAKKATTPKTEVVSHRSPEKRYVRVFFCCSRR